MAALVYRGTELRDLSVRRCWFGVDSGWRDGLGVRGRDTVIVGMPGQFVTARADHVRVIRLTGHVLATDEANWDEVCAELEVIFDPALTPGVLTVTSPYLGLVAGSMSIDARTADYRTVQRVAYLVTEYDVTLHAVGSPPDWA